MSIQLLALACGLALLSAVQAQTSCPSLNQTAQSSVSPSCSAHSDCSGLTCVNSNLGWTVRLVVHPCTDPVVVDVYVNFGNGVTLFTFTKLGQQQEGDVAVYLLRYRNASHIFVRLTSSSETLIPPVYIPLNPGVCMCNSIESIISAASSSASCVKNADCTGAICTRTYAGGLVSIKMTGTIHPCTDPPSFEMIISGPQSQIFRRTFSHSEIANVSSSNLDALGFSDIRLNVTMIEMEYSEIIEVDVLYSGNKLTVVPRQQVILDKTKCVPRTPTPAQPGSPFTSETCARLQKVAADTGLIFSCSVEDGCSGLTCEGLNHRMDLTIIPCNTPPAFNVMLFNSSNDLIYNKNITNQTTIPITAGIGINIQVKQSQDGVKMKASLDPTDTAIIPYTDIPLNRCQCTNIFCNFTTTSTLPPSQAPPTITRSQPTSTPRASPQTGSSNSILIISISVPLLVVIAIIIAATVVIVILVFARGYFRSQRQFTFQQMSTIVNTADEEDDEGSME